MNEKIKELRKQAIIEKIEHYSWGDPAITHHLDEEKFAELIILECINQVELTWMNQNGWSRNAACVQSIKDYFKVE